MFIKIRIKIYVIIIKLADFENVHNKFLSFLFYSYCNTNVCIVIPTEYSKAVATFWLHLV